MENCRGGGLQGHDFEKIISLVNLFKAWRQFKRGKLKKPDVGLFAVSLEAEIFGLHRILVSGAYKHGHYTSFFLHDPKLRHIHKASVADRVLHQAIFQV